MSNLQAKRIALVYDRVNKWGGAERVLLALHKLFPNAPLYTSVYNSKFARWANIFNVRTSFLQKLPLASNNHEFLPLFTPVAFEGFSFDNYDLVISVTSEAAKGIITKPTTKHICYCLTPTRYLWSGYEEYFRNPVLRNISKPAVSYLRRLDKIAAQRPDGFIAISEEVKQRIKKYYNRESEVVYPPIGLANGNPSAPIESDPAGKKMSHIKRRNRGGYFLVVSRLVPYKKIDIVIEACNELKLHLKIIGTGSDERRLRSLAGSDVEFIGTVDDNELASYYLSCKALIFPGNEDFGLVMAEAQAAGKPVIAYRRGGALEIIAENKTGLFFDDQNKMSLIKALTSFDSKYFSSDECKKQAGKFSINYFNKQFIKTVNSIMNDLK